MPRVLFMGGCKDGERLNLTELRPHMYFDRSIRPNFPVVDWNTLDQTVPNIQIKTEVYKLERMRAEEAVFHLYVPDSWTGPQMLQALIEGYTNKEPK